MAKPGKKSVDPAQVTHDQIVTAVFRAGESMGINDRDMLEQLTDQVSRRLKVAQPLPGMEQLVETQQPRKAPTPELQEYVAQLLSADEFTPQVSSKFVSGIELSDNALRVLETRYLQKDGDHNVIETPQDLFRRVARHVASAELNYDPNADVSYWEDQFYDLMASLLFLPNSPTLMNAGRELGQLSACFVLPVYDSMESIFDAVKYTALIHKSGGGTGFSFSNLRPEKDTVGSTGGVASGPVSFMQVFDTTTDVIKQGGMRRGANMAILRVDHPDILHFIEVKGDPNTLTNFNLSVGITDAFMQAVEQGSDYVLTNPHTGQAVGSLNAKDVFDKVVHMAWKTGDPGIVFLDKINANNPTPHLGSIESTNPCGEQPLLPYESCNLGSVCLSRMVTHLDGKPTIDYARLASTIKLAVRFLDDVIDVNEFPLPQIRERTLATRKIGLGVMGFADLLIQLGIAYNSQQGLDAAEEIAHFVSQESDRASLELATERGVFPAFEGSIYDGQDEARFRNASRTTVAPTGSLSIIGNCSSSIEPIFGLTYVRHILDDQEFIEVNPYFEQAAKEQGFYSDDLMKLLAEGTRLQDVPDVPEKVKRLFVTAHDISPDWHVKMQAAFQRHTNAAVSKTVNFPTQATPDDIARVYMLAHQESLKGITIYRDRSRDSQVLTVARPEEKEEPALVPRKRPKVTRGITERVSTGCGYIYVNVNFDDHGLFEVFSTLGKAGGCAAAQLEAISRLTSLALRSGLDVDFVVRHLRGIRCPAISWEQGHAVMSCADAIATVLGKYGRDGGQKNQQGAVQNSGEVVRSEAGQCPDCGSALIHQEGCNICPNCGFTKCE